MKITANPPDVSTENAPAHSVVEITSLDQFSAIACAPRTFQFEMNEKKFAVRIRPLDAEESADLEKITDRVQPPMKDGFPDKENAGYQERLAQAWDQRRLLTFDLALLSFKIPDGDIGVRIKSLKKKLPPGVPHEIFMQILKITSSPIENGIFTISADSQNTPS